jgi:hypothetical protein
LIKSVYVPGETSDAGSKEDEDEDEDEEESENLRSESINQ